MNIKQITIAVLLVVLLGAAMFLLGKCSTKADRQQGIDNLIAARDSVNTFSAEIGGLRNTVVEKNAMILTQNEAIKAGVVEKERLKVLDLKTLITNAELSATIKILRDSLDLSPNVVFVTTKDTAGNHLAVLLPYEWKYSDKYVSLITGIRTNKKAYFEIGVPFSGTMSIGYVKTGFMKTTPKGVFTTENPYLKVNQMEILIVEEPKTIFQKTWLHVLVGATGGIVAYRFLVK